MWEYADIIYYNESDLDSPIPNVYIYVVWTASYSSVLPTLSMIHFKSYFFSFTVGTRGRNRQIKHWK